MIFLFDPGRINADRRQTKDGLDPHQLGVANRANRLRLIGELSQRNPIVDVVLAIENALGLDDLMFIQHGSAAPGLGQFDAAAGREQNHLLDPPQPGQYESESETRSMSL